jgi:alkaline phosphatase
MAERAGLATGIVTTTRITHATPAAVFAHSPERGWENDTVMAKSPAAGNCMDIARQLVDFAVGDGIDVALGGGRGNFFGADKGGWRLDAGADLVAHWQTRYPDGAYVETASALASLDLGKTSRLFGLFSPSHMTYQLERSAGTDEPTLSEMTAAALEILSHDEDGYYLMVESGRIDHAHHMGVAEAALAEAQEFSRALEVVLARVDLEDTLILVTADHSHVFTMAGYPARGNPILGLVRGNDKSGEATGEPSLAADGHSYTTLGYANGPGAVQGPRPEPDLSPGAKQQALVPTGYRGSKEKFNLSETHGGEDVALFAGGPWAHLASGVIEQNVIFHIMAHALGLTPEKD